MNFFSMKRKNSLFVLLLHLSVALAATVAAAHVSSLSSLTPQTSQGQALGHDGRATSVSVVATTQCPESMVADVATGGTSVVLREFNKSAPNYFVMYFQTGGIYAIRQIGSEQVVSISLYTGCGRSDDTVLALSRTGGSITFSAWNYSSVVVEVSATSRYATKYIFEITELSAQSPSVHTLTDFFGTATAYDSGGGERAYDGADFRQYTTFRFNYTFAAYASLNVKIASSSSSSSPSSVYLKSSTWPECCALKSAGGEISVSASSECMGSFGDDVPELVVALESVQYPLLSDLFLVSIAGTSPNSHCGAATEFVFDSLLESTKTMAFTTPLAGPLWYSMAVTEGEGEEGEGSGGVIVHVYTTCGTMSVYTGCDGGTPDNLTGGAGSRKQSFLGESSTRYKIVLDECPSNFVLCVSLDEFESSESGSDGESDSEGRRRSDSGEVPAVVPSGSSGETSGDSSSNDTVDGGSVHRVGESPSWVLVVIIFIVAVIVVTVAIAIVVAVSKKNDNLRLEWASRDLAMAFDGYSEDDEFNSLDDIDDGVSLLKLSKSEKKKLIMSNEGDSDDDDDGSVPL